MGGILLRDLLASSLRGEWGLFNCTLIKVVHLPHESVGAGTPPLPRLPCLRLVEVDRLVLADVRASDIASVGGACYDVRGRACLALRWRVVGADKTPGSELQQARPMPVRRSVLLHPPSSS